MDGLLLINKESGITSYDVIRMLKRDLPRKHKIGHAGTLDPFASGLLVILLGRATKLNDYFQTVIKGYEVTAEFGYETDTQDPTGVIIKKSDSPEIISEQEIVQSLKRFRGNISQIPPRFSAKKIDGKRAYDLARDGKEFEIQPKEVIIHEIKMTNYNWPMVDFKMSVSSGTYIRTLVVDIARSLDTYATSVNLKRTSIGEHSVENALSSTEIGKVNIADLIIPLS